MRLALADGQWCELRERLTHGQARELNRAFLAAKADPSLAADVPLALMQAYVSAWHVLDFDGNAVPLDTPEQAPDSVLVDIAAAAVDLWNGSRTIPKAGTVQPLSSRRARRSA